MLGLLHGCQQKSTSPQTQSAPASAGQSSGKIINLDPKPGETIELGADGGTVNLEGTSAVPTAKPAPKQGTPAP